MGIGTNLKRLLALKKMTIKELSEKTGIPLNTLYSLTRRDSDTTRSEYLWAIANTLNVGIEELVNTQKVQILYGLSALDQPGTEIMDCAGKDVTGADIGAIADLLSREERNRLMEYAFELKELHDFRSLSGDQK